MRRLRMNLPVALVLAVLLHLLLLLGGELFPGLRAAWLPQVPERPPDPEPLRFTFVDTPDRPEPERPPEAARPSDRTRKATSEPAPENLPPSADPFSRGNTDQRVDAQPSDPVSPAAPAVETREAVRPPASPARPSRVQPEPMFPPPAPEEAEPPEADGEEAEKTPTESKIEAIQDALRPFSTRDLDQRYDNPATPTLTEFGPISFDTVGVDWGPYARKIVEIIRARWLERMPPAARMGIAGRSVLSFRIALDGAVSGIVLRDSSGHRPLDKAAEFAIEASELPPLPPAFRALGGDRDSVGVTFEFYYNMRVPER